MLLLSAPQADEELIESRLAKLEYALEQEIEKEKGSAVGKRQEIERRAAAFENQIETKLSSDKAELRTLERDEGKKVRAARLHAGFQSAPGSRHCRPLPPGLCARRWRTPTCRPPSAASSWRRRSASWSTPRPRSRRIRPPSRRGSSGATPSILLPSQLALCSCLSLPLACS